MYHLKVQLQDPDDLSFHVGDVIEIIEETNADWWTGRFNGKQGLLPANHVEKLPVNGVPSAPAPVTTTRTILAPPPKYDSPAAPSRARVPYKPFGAAHHGADRPPPTGSGATNSVGLQEAEGQDQKKSKFGKYGNTVSVSLRFAVRDH